MSLHSLPKSSAAAKASSPSTYVRSISRLLCPPPSTQYGRARYMGLVARKSSCAHIHTHKHTRDAIAATHVMMMTPQHTNYCTKACVELRRREATQHPKHTHKHTHAHLSVLKRHDLVARAVDDEDGALDVGHAVDVGEHVAPQSYPELEHHSEDGHHGALYGTGRHTHIHTYTHARTHDTHHTKEHRP